MWWLSAVNMHLKLVRDYITPERLLVLSETAQFPMSGLHFRDRLPKTQTNQNKPKKVPIEGATFLSQMTFFFFFFLIFIYLFIILFLAVLGLRFCARAFSSCGKRGPLFIAVRGPLAVAASLVAEHRLQTRRLSSCGSRA